MRFSGDYECGPSSRYRAHFASRPQSFVRPVVIYFNLSRPEFPRDHSFLAVRTFAPNKNDTEVAIYSAPTAKMSTALLDYLQQQPGVTFRKLYRQPSTVLAVLRRMLPHLGEKFRWGG